MTIPWYDKPDAINYEQIDPAIRDLVRAINACGWMNTTMSCSGHPVDTDERDDWSPPGIGKYAWQVHRGRLDMDDGDHRFIKKPFDPYEWCNRMGLRWVETIKRCGGDHKHPDAVRTGKTQRLAMSLCHRWLTEARLYVIVYDMTKWGRLIDSLWQFIRAQNNPYIHLSPYYAQGAPDGSWHHFQTIFRYLVSAERAAFFAAFETALKEVSLPKN